MRASAYAWEGGGRGGVRTKLGVMLGRETAYGLRAKVKNKVDECPAKAREKADTLKELALKPVYTVTNDDKTHQLCALTCVSIFVAQNHARFYAPAACSSISLWR